VVFKLRPEDNKPTRHTKNSTFPSYGVRELKNNGTYIPLSLIESKNTETKITILKWLIITEKLVEKSKMVWKA